MLKKVQAKTLVSKTECILPLIYTPKLSKIVTIKHHMPKNITISTEYDIL